MSLGASRRSAALTALVDHYVTPDLIRAVAREAGHGRLLWVATTDLDREETVIWDLGAIAMRGGEPARKLFRDVVVASASIPGVFEPVLIHVQQGGRLYDEMHVDGNVSSSLFIAPAAAYFSLLDQRSLDGARVYVLINGQIIDAPETTPFKLRPIVARTFSAALKHMSRAQVVAVDQFAEKYLMAVQSTYLPFDYPKYSSADFRASTMRPLFEYGARCAQKRTFVDHHGRNNGHSRSRRAGREATPDDGPGSGVPVAGRPTYGWGMAMKASFERCGAGNAMSAPEATGWLRDHSGRFMSAGIVLAVLHFGRSVLIPLALAVMLSLLVAPLVRVLRRIRVGRAYSVLVAVAALGVLCVGVAVALARRSCASARAFLNTNRMYNASSTTLEEVTIGPIQRLTNETSRIAGIRQAADAPLPAVMSSARRRQRCRGLRCCPGTEFRTTRCGLYGSS